MICYNEELLKKSELFSGLLEDDNGYVLSRVSAMQIRKGAVLFSPGDCAERFYIVINGSIRVFRQKENGSTEEIALFTAHDVLGEFDFARRAVYDATALAAEDTELLCFPGIGFTMDSLSKEKPDTVSRIMLRALAIISSRLRSTQKLITENTSWVQELRRRAFEDPATGLWNRTFLEEEISRELQAPMAIILMKPDRFKVLVDTWGHHAGDDAMAAIAGILKGIIRRIGRGWALRLKSNEVGLCISKCDLASAADIAEQLHHRIAQIPPPPVAGMPESPRFTFSATVVYGLWPDVDEDWKQAVQSVYAFLMEQWQAGGNRVAALKGKP
ncbi:MAG: diguanylate cyclase [Termitinemataceae bacterium]